MSGVNRGGCRFVVASTNDGKPAVRMELFHDRVPALSEATLIFDLLTGATPENAKKLAELMNEWILGISLFSSR
jgi:hypothetical protein